MSGRRKRVILVRVDWRVYAITFFLMPVIGLAFYLVLGISAKIALWKIATTMIALVPLNAFVGGIILGFGPLGGRDGLAWLLAFLSTGRAGSVARAYHRRPRLGVLASSGHSGLHIFRNGLDWPQFVVLYPISTILVAFTMGTFGDGARAVYS